MKEYILCDSINMTFRNRQKLIYGDRVENWYYPWDSDQKGAWENLSWGQLFILILLRVMLKCYTLKIYVFHSLSVSLNPILFDPMDYSPTGSSVHRILQKGVGCHSLLQRIFQHRDQTHFSSIDRLILYHYANWETQSHSLATAWAVAHQASLSMRFPMQEY